MPKLLLYFFTWTIIQNCFSQVSFRDSNEVKSNFWELTQNYFCDSSIVTKFLADKKRVDSIKFNLIKKANQAKSFYDLHNTYSDLLAITASSDTSWLSDNNRQYLKKYVSAVGYTYTRLDETNYKPVIAFNNYLIKGLVQMKDDRALSFAIAYGVNDIDHSLKSNPNTSQSISSIDLPLSFHRSCYYNINVSNQYFDDQNLELFVLNDFYLGQLLGKKVIDSVRFGFLERSQKRILMTNVIRTMLSTLIGTDLYQFISHIPYSDFSNTPFADPFRHCRTQALDNDQRNKWFVFVFYRNCLTYIQSLQSCQGGNVVTINYPKN